MAAAAAGQRRAAILRSGATAAKPIACGPSTPGAAQTPCKRPRWSHPSSSCSSGRMDARSCTAGAWAATAAAGVPLSAPGAPLCPASAAAGPCPAAGSVIELMPVSSASQARAQVKGRPAEPAAGHAARSGPQKAPCLVIRGLRYESCLNFRPIGRCFRFRFTVAASPAGAQLCSFAYYCR